MIYAVKSEKLPLEKERKERKPVPEARRAGARIRAPWKRVFISSLADHGSTLALRNMKLPSGKEAEFVQTPLLRKWGAGKVGVVWSPRTGGDSSWRIRGQEKGRKWSRQLLNIWSHRELIIQRPKGQWGGWGALSFLAL